MGGRRQGVVLRWSVCLAARAKSAFHAYTGVITCSNYSFRTMTTAAEQLAKSGLDVPTAQMFIFLNIASPASIYSVFKVLGLSNAMIAEVAGAPGAVALVRQFFEQVGLDAQALDVEPGASAGFNTVVTSYTPGVDNRSGTAGADNLSGLAGDDTLDGLAGNDVLSGGDGNDILYGGRGLDWLAGGSGNDRLYAGTFATESTSSYYDVGSHSYVTATTYQFDDVHAEFLFGGTGDDRLYGGYGSDWLEGGEGDDWLEGDYNAEAASNATTAELRLMLNDTLYGGPGADTLMGGKGDDVYLYNSLAMFNLDDVPVGETISDTGGTDTIRVLTSTNFKNLNGGTVSLASMGIEQVLITSAETATFTAAQLAGTSTKINAAASLGAKLVVEGSSGSNDYSQLSFASFGGNNAFDAGVDQLTFNLGRAATAFTGTALGEHIEAGPYTKIVAGAGDDVMSFDYGAGIRPGLLAGVTVDGGAGVDTLVLWSGLDTRYADSNIHATDSMFAALSGCERLELLCTSSATVTLGVQANRAFADGITITCTETVAGWGPGSLGLTVLGLAATVPITAIGTHATDNLQGGAAHDTFTGGLGADRFTFVQADVDTAAGMVTDTVTDFKDGEGDRMVLGIVGSAGNYVEGGSYSSLSELLGLADMVLNGTIQICAGAIGGDVYVVADSDGIGYTQVIKLAGITLQDIDFTHFV